MRRLDLADADELVRAPIFHTPGRALETFADGGLLIRDGRVAALGDYAAVRQLHSDVPVRDLRGGYVLPGFIDTHVHFPQIRILGGLGCQLLDWLDQVALPEEARMADLAYAEDTAQRFVQALASHGTTTALVFGSHFEPATATLFDAAERSGLRMVSGLVMSDRLLRPELHQTVEQAYRESSALIRKYHGKGRLLYAVTPRFALSTTEAMLEVCQTLLHQHAGLRAQTHINENAVEVAEVARLFPWAEDYLAVYERYGLCRAGAVMAHNIHASDSELARMAQSGTAVAHCPCSNAMLGSGLFPMRRHVDAGVLVALGSDVGGGVGFGMMKEGLQAYALQRLASDGMHLNAGNLLYLATLAGAEALRLEQETGDFSVGKSADYVYVQPVRGGILEGALERADSFERTLAVLFTLAGPESIHDVCIGGRSCLTN